MRWIMNSYHVWQVFSAVLPWESGLDPEIAVSMSVFTDRVTAAYLAP